MDTELPYQLQNEETLEWYTCYSSVANIDPEGIPSTGKTVAIPEDDPAASEFGIGDSGLLIGLADDYATGSYASDAYGGRAYMATGALTLSGFKKAVLAKKGARLPTSLLGRASGFIRSAASALLHSRIPLIVAGGVVIYSVFTFVFTPKAPILVDTDGDGVGDMLQVCPTVLSCSLCNVSTGECTRIKTPLDDLGEAMKLIIIVGGVAVVAAVVFPMIFGKRSN